MTDQGIERPPPPPDAARFAETRAARACSLITFALVMLFSLLAFYSLVVEAPRFLLTFEGIKMELPGVTILVLALRPVLAPLVFLAAIASVVKEFAVRNRLATLVTNGVHLVLLVAIREMVRLALFMPLLTPMHRFGEG